MARRGGVIKKKKLRVTHSEAYLINKKYMGDEPTFKNPVLTLGQYADCLNWYNCMADMSDAREYMTTYLKEADVPELLAKFKQIPDNWVSLTACWTARLISRGYVLPTEGEMFILNKLEEAFSKIKTVEKTAEIIPFPKKNVQAKIKDKEHDIIAEIESLIDKEEEFSLYEWLKTNNVPALYCNAIFEKYAPWLQDLLDAYEGSDAQLKQAYRYLTKAQLKKKIMFFQSIMDDLEKYQDTTKKVRKPRKPRAVSVEKQLKAFKYQKENAEYKIASVNPEKILGSQELWAFNTKYKTLTVFRALDRGGLKIKGTSIINYDEKNSVSKRIGRKTEEYVNKVLNAGKVALRKLMDEIKTDVTFSARINENIILLRVEK